MPTTTICHLPVELQLQLARFLSLHDLSVCVRVSHAWRQVFNPALYQHCGCEITTNPPFFKEYPKNTMDEVTYDRDVRLLACARAGTLLTNGHLIQSLQIQCLQSDFLLRLLENPANLPATDRRMPWRE
ncbi:hypothetical protein BGX33_006212 [Mortierella sp. NVP41]|nr:hypothetical protein BGX33_006212 [Mortierella sp. NVP41]